MKTAVVYYSMSGNTKMIAEVIAERIGGESVEIIPVKQYPSEGARKFIWGGMKAVMGTKPKLQPYKFDGSYDRVIIGTPVWASNISPPIRSFIHENREALTGKDISAFVCYAGGGADKALEKLKQTLDIDKLNAELILVDPKDKPSPENDEKIEEFCRNVAGE